MTALKSDPHVELSFRGRFKFGIDQWAYVPFDVPAGTQRIDVSTSHDRFSLLGIGRNVLDLGIFGPAGHELGNTEGFRGWSGGARAGFMLSAVNATPGYLAAIAACESGGNPGAIGGGGMYRGAFQMTYAAWQSVGGTGDPAAAPMSEQVRRAAMLYAQSGPGQWPVCGQ